MSQPTPTSAQWTEAPGTGAVVERQRLALRLDADGFLVPTDEQTGILLRDDGTGTGVASDDTARTVAVRLTLTPSAIEAY